MVPALHDRHAGAALSHTEGDCRQMNRLVISLLAPEAAACRLVGRLLRGGAGAAVATEQ